MRTNALIEALAKDIEPVRRARTWRRFAAAGAVGAALAGMIVVGVFGIRPDLSAAALTVAAKNFYCLLAVAAAAPLAFALSQPNTGARKWLWPSLFLILASLGAAGAALVMTAPDLRLSTWLAGGFPECLRRIPILATPVAAALLFVVRGLSPTRLTLAGAALGGLSGAIAAVAYSWFCPVDSIAYIATWYLASILLCAALGAALGRWLLRW